MDENKVRSNDQATYNKNVYWKRHKHVLGMRFEIPKHMKRMMCHYGVANGYRLCKKRPFRLRVS